MKFNVKCVREQLEKKGIVYTIRSFKNELVKQVNIEGGIGLCRITLIGEVKKESDIKMFLESSGFKQSEKWWAVATRMYQDKQKYLYRIEKYDK